MRFRCGPTKERKRINKESWHLWFAWRPIWVEHTVDKGCWHWLEYIARKGTCEVGWESTYWTWEYMEMGDE